MTESPVSTLEQKKDRRGLLALIGAGGAAAVAALLSHSNDGAEAAGPTYHESSTPTPAVHGNNTIWGPGVQGNSENGRGVYGVSNGGSGVYGYSAGNTGVQGGSASGDGVRGFSSSGFGVFGTTFNRDGVRAARTALLGTGAGVQGFSGVGQTDAPDQVGGRFVGRDTGVRGEGKFGVRGKGKWAVLGKADTAGGAGVVGEAGTGSVGVRADGGPGKTALLVRGHARFREAGKATVTPGAWSKVVPLTFTLAPGSLVVATLQGNAGAGVAVRTASKYGSNKIRITLTKAATKNATIAYFIFTP